MKTNTVSLSTDFAAAAFAALGSEQRLSVLQILVRVGHDGLSMGELAKRSGITGSTLTHHLQQLSTAGLVTQRKQGRLIIAAAVNYEQVEILSQFLLQNCCIDSQL